MEFALNLVCKVLRVILPEIRIHTWGGYGSQIYGIYLYLELENVIPYRRSRIFVHTSGITERSSEISHYKHIKSTEISDFNSNVLEGDKAKKIEKNVLRTRAEKWIRNFLIISGFLSESNNTHELNRIKPWVLTIRGHYTRIQFNIKTLERLYKAIEGNNQLGERDDCLGIQYRLGDLTKLSNKYPTSPDAILDAIHQIDLGEIKRAIVFSDSLDEALDLLRTKWPNQIFLEGSSAGPEEAILKLCKCNYFIGTTAKLSVWIVVFRVLLLKNSNNFIQENFKEELEAHGILSGITYY